MIESQISSFNLIYRTLIREDKLIPIIRSNESRHLQILNKNHRSNAYCYKQFHISHNIFQEDLISFHYYVVISLKHIILAHKICTNI